MKKPAVVINIIIVIGVVCISTNLVFKQSAIRQSMELYHVVKNHQYEKELAKARRDGVSLDINSYVRTAPPDKLNAAPLYIELTKYKIDAEEVNIESMKKHDKSNDESYRKFVASHSKLYNLIHKTTDCPFFYVNRNFANPVDITFREYSETRRCTRLLRMESIGMAGMNNGTKSVMNMAKGFQPGNHVTQEPFLYALYVSCACDTITFRGFQDIMDRTHGDYKTALAVKKSIREYYLPHPISDFLKFEMAWKCACFVYLKKHSIDDYYRMMGIREPDPQYKYYKSHWVAIIDLNGISLMKTMRSVIPIVDLPYPQAYPNLNAMDNTFANQKGIKYYIAKNLYQKASEILKKHTCDLATANITLAAADIFIYKAKHGTFPDRLEQACAKPLQDPFVLKPLKYKRDGKGFIVYSVGETGQYDGHLLKKGEYEQMYRYTGE